MKNLFTVICILAVTLLSLSASRCESDEEIYVYKVETWDIEGIGECECHIRMDDVEQGHDSITCYSITGDTVHYVVNY